MWGAGPALGFLTVLGYLVFVTGAALLWRYREEVVVWIIDEIGAFRRVLSRHTVIGPFYGPRLESRLRSLPAYFVASFNRMPRTRIYGAAFLMCIGPLLFLLDFFI